MSILIQHAFGESKRLLEITAAHHARWAKKHGWEHFVDTKHELRMELPDHQTGDYVLGCWEKWRVVCDVLSRANDNELCVWVDSDVVVVGRLDDSLPDGQGYELGLTGWPGQVGFQSGCFYMRAGDGMRSFASDVIRRGHIEGFSEDPRLQWDERTMNERLPYSGLSVRLLMPKWNGPDDGIEDLRARAWHGVPTLAKPLQMAQFIKERPECQP
jgi:hypothetical protein